MSEADCFDWMLQRGLAEAVRNASMGVFHTISDVQSRDAAIKAAAESALEAFEFQLQCLSMRPPQQ